MTNDEPEIKPVEILPKRKWRVGQTAGRHKGGHNMQGVAKKKKQGKPDPPNDTVLILLPNGKKRFTRGSNG